MKVFSLFPDVNLLDLFKAFFSSRRVSESELATPWLKSGYRPYWFSRSAWSLKIIALWRLSFTKNEILYFWVPDYFCNESLAPLRETEVRLIFYPVTESMAPDWDACEQLAQEHAPHFFLLPHYFGIAAPVVKTRQFCDRYQAIFIEDCAHVLLPTGVIGKNGDFILYSQHKLLAIPDGALLLVRASLHKMFKQSEGDFFKSFEAIVSTLPQKTLSVYPWVIKRVLHKLAPKLVVMLRQFRHPSTNNGTSEPVLALGGTLQSPFARSLLADQLSRIESYGWQRKHNVSIFRAMVVGDPDMSFIAADESGFPYMLGIQCHTPDKYKYFKQLFTTYCPMTTWPDLAPEVLAHPELHSAAIKLFNRCIFFPVHQSIQMRRLLRSIPHINGSKKKVFEHLNIRWEKDLIIWAQVFNQTRQSHLLQSPAYVEALCLDKRCKAKYGVIEQHGEVLAIFAVIEKRGPFGITIARLNRGPIWMQPSLDPNIKIAALNLISRYYSNRRGRLLFMAPNLAMTNLTLSDVTALGLRRRLLRPVASIWVDLQPELSILRSLLDGKWRNQLVLAERSGLSIEISEEKSVFEWLLVKYDELVSHKKFSGPTRRFLEYLWHTTTSSGQHFWILRVAYQGQYIAGIALISHADAATYLLGWNSEEGRRVNANNFLLWHALILLKEKGYTWFDLGGVDEYTTPGITNFKRGLRGQEYRLLGEYANFG